MENYLVYIAFGFAVAGLGSSVGNEYRLKKLQKRIDELEKK